MAEPPQKRQRIADAVELDADLATEAEMMAEAAELDADLATEAEMMAETAQAPELDADLDADLATEAEMMAEAAEAAAPPRDRGAFAVDLQWVPEVGSVLAGGLRFEPGAGPRGHILAIDWPCARGKSHVIRKYIADALRGEPGRRFMLMSAGISYGRNLTAELRRDFPGRVGFYQDDPEPQAQIYVCSFESIWRAAAGMFDDVIVDEVRSIARLVGGETLPIDSICSLTGICARARSVVVCDADLEFRSSDAEDTTLVEDFLKVIAPERPVLKVRTSHPGPAHLKRSATLYFNNKEDKRLFWEALERAVDAWHATKENAEPARVAVFVATKTQRAVACKFLDARRVPFKHYDSETSGDARLELADPDAAWRDVGAVVATTSLSVGVDPKSTSFGRVFLMSHPQGCFPLSMMQGVRRIARHPCAVFDPDVQMMLCCKAPDLVAAEARVGVARPPREGLLNAEVRAVAAAKGRRSAFLRQEGSSLAAMEQVSDGVIRILAHNRLEAVERTVNHWGTWRRVLAHNGVEWRRASHSAPAERGEVSGEGADEELRFSAMATRLEKLDWALSRVRGDEDFLQDGWGLPEKRPDTLDSRGKVLRDVFFLSRHFASFQFDADQLLEMERPGFLDGIELAAHMRCLSAKQQFEVDAWQRKAERLAHPMLRVGVGARMQLAARVGDLLGISLVEGGELPRPTLQRLNRFVCKAASAEDEAWMAELRGAAEHLCFRKPDRRIGSLLSAVATAAGLRLETSCKNEPRADAEAGGRARQKVYGGVSMSDQWDVAKEWRVHSPALGCRVRAADWAALHEAADEDRAQTRHVAELAELDAPAPGPIGSVLIERLSAEALAAALRTHHDADHVAFLRALDAAAGPADEAGVRENVVSYSKKRLIGRRQATHPSMQSCPSSLRKALVGALPGGGDHDVDIVNAHPTLIAGEARRLGVRVRHIDAYAGVGLPLAERRQWRQVVLDRIVDLYGCTPRQAKDAVLRVTNGGSAWRWAQELGLRAEPAGVLEDLREDADKVRAALLADPARAEQVKALREQLQIERAADVAAADAAVAQEPSDERKQNLQRAKRKAEPRSIELTLFSLIVAEMEDKALSVMEEYLVENGWTVTARIYDGIHVAHRPGHDLREALNGAEARLDAVMGFGVGLLEKPLHTSGCI